MQGIMSLRRLGVQVMTSLRRLKVHVMMSLRRLRMQVMMSLRMPGVRGMAALRRPAQAQMTTHPTPPPRVRPVHCGGPWRTVSTRTRCAVRRVSSQRATELFFLFPFPIFSVRKWPGV